MATLFCKCALEMDCPKEVVIWNYFDHEHVVGTHFKHYTKARVVAEADGWCLVERWYKLPIINLHSSSMGFMELKTPNHIRSFQYGKLGVQMEQDIFLEDLGPDRCRVTCEYRTEVPAPMKLLQPLFERVVTRWFHNTWEEDAPMRIRRWKVWKLGFRNFVGLKYIDQKTSATAHDARPYPIELPVPKSTSITEPQGIERPFSESVEVGY